MGPERATPCVERADTHRLFWQLLPRSPPPVSLTINLALFTGPVLVEILFRHQTRTKMPLIFPQQTSTANGLLTPGGWDPSVLAFHHGNTRLKEATREEGGLFWLKDLEVRSRLVRQQMAMAECVCVEE